jgi:hypothetical protein
MPGQKIPPPPPIANMPELNRWLLEVTSILAAAGGVDPAAVEGLEATQAQVVLNTAAIAVLQGTTGGQSFQITQLQLQINGLQNDVVTINGQITTLGARNQVFNGAGAPNPADGVDGDWYARTAAPNRQVFVKLAGVWTAVTAAF